MENDKPQSYSLEDYNEVVYGKNWSAVLDALSSQKENFSNLGEKNLGSLFTVVAEVAGHRGINVLALFLKENTLSTTQIKEKTRYELAEIRKILYALDGIGLAHPKVVTGKIQVSDEVFSVDEGQLKQKLPYLRKKNIDRITAYVEEAKKQTACCINGHRTTYENALENNFHCSECSSVLDICKPPKIVEVIEEKLKDGEI